MSKTSLLLSFFITFMLISAGYYAGTQLPVRILLGAENDGAKNDRHTTEQVAETALTLDRLVGLEAEVGVLRQSLHTLQQHVEALKGSEVWRQQSTDSAVESEIDSVAEPIPEASIERSPRDQISQNGRVQEALLSAGVDADTVRELQSRLDQQTLAELDLRDTAAREGWIDSEDYAERRKAMLPEPVNLRSELGDSVWDNYLTALGQDNRVRIDSVIEGSAAYIADIRTGDVLIEYAGERIFSIRELQRATRAGERGEIVYVVVERDSAAIDALLERGPLGVTLSSLMQTPLPLGMEQ